MSNPKYERLLTRDDVCDMLQVSKRQLRRMELAGSLPRVKLSFRNIRYLKKDVEDLIKGRRVEQSY
jgi:predicted DNA-binding transcriptional regulator AlpA